jgi:glutamate dehydrogenase
VGDKANDSLRINGSQLRVRVVGEGGNLGFTQLGRIEAALNNVSINTDAIDNSAGVDTSDHEVNLKILLSLRTDADFTTEKRNQLLASLTDDVGRQVLDDNIYQNELLTVARAQAHSMAPVHQRMMRDWHKHGVIDRELENLPNDRVMAMRIEQGAGLTKPELSVLVAHAKISLTEALLQGTAIDEPWSEKYLIEYFPAALRLDFRAEILAHPLRREIAATVISNNIINRGGITTVWRALEESGATIDDVVKATVIAIDAGGLEDLYLKVDELGPDKWNIRIDLLKEIRRYIDRVSRWLVTNRGSNLDVARDVERFGAATNLVRSHLKSHLRGHELERWVRQSKGYVDRGVPESMADAIAGLLDEYAAFDLAELAASHGVSLEEWSQTYFAISDELGGDMLLSTISALSRDDRWQTMARAALRADMYTVLASVTEKVLLSSMNSSFEDRLIDWLTTQSVGITRVKDLLSEIAQRSDVDIAAISVALRTLRSLVTQTAASK